MGTKAYPKEFTLSIWDIADRQCEQCKSNYNLSIHHIIPRGSGKTIHQLWNGILLCEKCHTPGDYEKKKLFLRIHIDHLIGYCLKWNKKPNPKCTRLIPGAPMMIVEKLGGWISPYWSQETYMDLLMVFKFMEIKYKEQFWNMRT